MYKITHEYFKINIEAKLFNIQYGRVTVQFGLAIIMVYKLNGRRS